MEYGKRDVTSAGGHIYEHYVYIAPDYISPKFFDSLRDYRTSKHEYPELKDLKIIGTIFDTYIIGKDSEQLYLVDQHAAHERIFFEKFMDSYENAETLTQPLMIPVTFNVAYDVKSDENAWIKVLENTGFEIEAFGPRTYKINAIPAFMDTDEAGRLINDFTSDPDTIDSYSEENTS